MEEGQLDYEKLGNKLTEPQYEFLNWLLMNIEYETGTSLINYIKILVQLVLSKY